MSQKLSFVTILNHATVRAVNDRVEVLDYSMFCIQHFSSVISKHDVTAM